MPPNGRRRGQEDPAPPTARDAVRAAGLHGGEERGPGCLPAQPLREVKAGATRPVHEAQDSAVCQSHPSGQAGCLVTLPSVTQSLRADARHTLC